MTSDIVLKIENLSKTFNIYSSPSGRLKEWLTFGSRTYHADFQALKDISFSVKKGEFLGIIGPNGAGKSTLLRIITGALDPTNGSYQLSGRILSLIDLNGGMEPELTGRENIIRSTRLLGFPPGYAEEQMPQIEAFAELGDFFDRPLKIYSSGMRIRLAFSMFAFLECDLLILDEVLAVGDIFFRQKCYARLGELIKKDTAIVLVTHSTGTVSQYCDNVIVMNKGIVHYYGEPGTAIQKYFEIRKDQGVKIKASDTYMEEDYVSISNLPSQSPSQDLNWPQASLFTTDSLPKIYENAEATLTHLLICNDSQIPQLVFKQGEALHVYYSFLLKKDIGVPIAGVRLSTPTNLLIHGKNSLQHKLHHPLRVSQGDILRYKQVIKLDVSPGRYILNISLATMHPSDYARIETLSTLEYKEKLLSVISLHQAGGIQVIPPSSGVATKGHIGICNLDGTMQIEAIINSNST